MNEPNVQRLTEERCTSRILGDEEEAWYRHDRSLESVAAIQAWLTQRAVVRSTSGNPLEDEEDAWVRR